LALLVVSQQASADFRVVLTQTGAGPANPLALTLHDTDGDGLITKTTAYGAFSTFTLTANSNYPGNSSGLLNTVTFDTRNSAAFSKTLTIEVFSDATTGAGFGPNASYSLPGTSGTKLDVTSTLSASKLEGTATYDSKIDSSSFTQLTLSSPNTVDTALSHTRGATYTLYGKIVLTLTASKSASLTATTEAVNPVPGPGGMTLLLSGLPVFGVGLYWSRRRNQADLVPVS